MPDDELQALYDEAARRGLFKSDTDLQQIGHEMRARGLVTDPTQGGLVAPAPTTNSTAPAPSAPAPPVLSPAQRKGMVTGTITALSDAATVPGVPNLMGAQITPTPAPAPVLPTIAPTRAPLSGVAGGLISGLVGNTPAAPSPYQSNDFASRLKRAQSQPTPQPNAPTPQVLQALRQWLATPPAKTPPPTDNPTINALVAPRGSVTQRIATRGPLYSPIPQTEPGLSAATGKEVDAPTALQQTAYGPRQDASDFQAGRNLIKAGIDAVTQHFNLRDFSPKERIGLSGLIQNLADSGFDLTSPQSAGTLATLALAPEFGVPGKVLAGLASGYFGAQGAQMIDAGTKKFSETHNIADLSDAVMGALMVTGTAFHLKGEIAKAAAERAAEIRNSQQGLVDTNSAFQQARSASDRAAEIERLKNVQVQPSTTLEPPTAPRFGKPATPAPSAEAASVPTTAPPAAAPDLSSMETQAASRLAQRLAARQPETTPTIPTPEAAPLTPDRFEMVDPASVTVNPANQYKKTGIVDNKNAVTDALKGTDVYDVDQGGVWTVFRDPNGNLEAINGHHRRELANRADRFVSIGPDGTLQDVPREVPVRVLDAKDGWTQPQARAYGALENIRDNKGTAIDALDVIHELGIPPDQFAAHGISQTSDMARNLQGLLTLDPQAIARVRMGDIPEQTAAGVGSVKGLSPESQRGAIDEAARRGYGTYGKGAALAQEYLADQQAGNLAGNAADGQIDMFGGEFNTARSTAGERIELKEAVARKLASERAELLKPTGAQLREGEKIDTAGRQAEAASMAESQKALAERVNLLYNQDAVRPEIARLAGDIANGRLTKQAAVDQLANALRPHVGRSVRELADPGTVSLDRGSGSGEHTAAGVADGGPHLFGTSAPEAVTPPSVKDRLQQAETQTVNRLKSRKRGLQSGIDPDDLIDLATLGAIKIAKGAVTFAEWSRSFLADIQQRFGDAYARSIEPHLQEIYDASVRHHDETLAPRFGLSRTTHQPGENFAAARAVENASPVPETPATGTRNADTEAERAARGQSPIERQAYTTMGSAFEQGRAAVDAGDIEPRSLAQSVALKPRPLTATEVGALGYDRARLVNEHTTTLAKLSDAIDKGDTVQQSALKAQLARIESDFDANDQALVKGGREQSAAFNARKMQINSDYSLVALKQRLKAANPDKPITPLEESKISGLSAKLEEANKRIADLEAQKAAAIPLRQNRAAQGVPAEFGKSNKIFTADRADAARARLREKMGRASAGIDPTTLSDLVEIGGYYLEGGLRKFSDWARQMKADIPGIPDIHLQAAWQQLTNAQRLKGTKTRLTNDIRDLQSRIVTGDLKPIPRAPIVLDKEAMDLKAQRDLLKAQIDSMIQAREPKGFLQRLTALHREFILSGPSVFSKLLGATAWGMPTETAADLFGAVAGKVTGLGKVAEREGTFSPRAEVAGYRALVSKEALRNAKETITTGMNTIDALGGQKPHAAELGGYVGRIHGAEKSFFQTAQYQKALQVRLEKAAARGLDVTNAEVQAQIGAGAAVDAINAKFQGANAFTDALNRSVAAWERSPAAGIRLLGTFFRTLAPITRVPANIAGRAIDMTGVGLVRGAALQASEAIKARSEGASIPPEVADKILRAYKYGGFGLVAAYIGLTQPAWFKASGYFDAHDPGNPDRNGNPLKVGDVEIGGRTVPKVLAHSPLIEAIQFWATVRRGYERHSAMTGAFQAARGVIEQAPGLESARRLAQAPEGEDKFGKWAGEYTRSLVVPQIVQQGASAMDKDAQGQPVKRKPRGFTEAIETGLPGLRQQVPDSTNKKQASRYSGGAKSEAEKMAASIRRSALPKVKP